MTLKFRGDGSARLFQVRYVQMIKPVIEKGYKNVDNKYNY
jgi:hypothetical protein